ncbi:uncharacterized protein BJX67DRAFT_307903 [Aspergillus lucknowensis]|uniref:Uncharacterized protein n=1 Tax=Aspergillus lucknowensis TaxID=176173 RepID=A0ABR4M010_9EURO
MTIPKNELHVRSQLKNSICKAERISRIPPYPPINIRSTAMKTDSTQTETGGRGELQRGRVISVSRMRTESPCCFREVAVDH